MASYNEMKKRREDAARKALDVRSEVEDFDFEEAEKLEAAPSIRAGDVGKRMLTPETRHEANKDYVEAAALEGVTNLALGGAGTVTKAAIAKTPQFKKWFGGSKVVDDAGEPLVVYHGTTAKTDFNEFKPQQGALPGAGAGFYFGRDPKKLPIAHRRTTVEESGRERIYPVYLRMEKPFVDKRGGSGWLGPDDVTRLKSQGYDGIIMHKKTGDPEYIVFDPSQIKSTYNKGAFDPTDPRINYGVAGGAIGAKELQDKMTLQESEEEK